MRKNLWLGVVAVLLFVLAACCDDKDDKDVAGEIAGTYVGTITVTQEDGREMGDPMENQKIYITRKGNNQVDLELKDFQFGDVPVGTLTIFAVEVANNGLVAGNASQVPVMGGTIKADLKVSGTVKEDKADLLIIVDAPVVPGGESVKMNVTFKGTK